MAPKDSGTRRNGINFAEKALNRGSSEWGKVYALTSIAQAIIYLADVMYKNGRNES